MSRNTASAPFGPSRRAPRGARTAESPPRRFEKHGISSQAHHLSALSEPERRYSETRKPLGVRRLSCQAILLGEVVIDVPPESQVHRQVVRKAAEVRDIRLDPVVRLCYVEVDEPDLDHPCGDLERLMTVLAKQRQVDQAGIAAPLPPRLQKLLRQGQWRVTAAVRAARAAPAAPMPPTTLTTP